MQFYFVVDRLGALF